MLKKALYKQFFETLKHFILEMIIIQIVQTLVFLFLYIKKINLPLQIDSSNSNSPMLFDQEILNNNFYEDNDDNDDELTGFIDTYQQNKNSKIHPKTNQTKNKLPQKEQQNRNHKKIQLPRQFQKAKRTLNKIVHDYFIQLKKQYERVCETLQFFQPSKNNPKDKFKKNQISFYLRKDQISSIVDSISKFVGINYKYKSTMELKFNYLQQMSKKLNFQSRKGSFSYLPECQKIVNLNLKGQINEIKISSAIKNFKLPDFATPVPYKDSIYFLDSAIFDKKNKFYKADKNTYKINEKGQISTIEKNRIKERIKCGIVRDESFIYLLGGMVGENKILTSSCEKFCPKSQEFQQISHLKLRHRCPSACIVKNSIWVLSQNGIQTMDKSIGNWETVQTPWNMMNLPFQFVAPISESQLIIFGGLDVGVRSKSVQVYNCQHNWVDVFDDILPERVCSQKIWGPSFTELGLVVLSSVMGQNQPDLKLKNNLTQSLYLTVNGIYLNTITIIK